MRHVLATLAVALGVAGPSGLAHAGDVEPAPPASSAPAASGATTVVAPSGSVGLTVVAPYPGGGQVVANGCSQVTVNGAPTWVTSTGAPCPQYDPYRPYAATPERPRHAPDGERSAALIASSVVFGVGGAAAGIAYIVAYENDDGRCNTDVAVPSATGGGTTYVPTTNGAACAHASARAPLVTYGALVGITPSVPRFVVGDTTGGLIFTGLRVASIAAAALIPWGKENDASWSGPFLLGFAAPVALAIVDLATTPHREDLEKETAGITSVAPVAIADRSGTHGGMIAIGGRF